MKNGNMYSRNITSVPEKSFFLFGPRGTGKSHWVRTTFSEALYLDLLDSDVYQELLSAPQRLGQRIPPGFSQWVVLDEVQKVPALLDEVHRLIETRQLRFVLTGSSARKLRRGGANLLAGRALLREMHPLTAQELGADFDLTHSMQYGQLPSVYRDKNAQAYLSSYVHTYLKEEIQQEGITRNLAGFARFLQAASFSQGSLLNVAAVARECAVERKTVEGYFAVLEDLFLAVRLPIFARRAQRQVVQHPKFYFFDAGVFRTLRPRGPLDPETEIDGAALETLVLQELRAHNANAQLGYELFCWRTLQGQEVDFVLYGALGLCAVEVKRSSRVHTDDFKGLQAFLQEYPMARCVLVYLGERTYWEGPIQVVPMASFLSTLGSWLVQNPATPTV